MLSCNTSTMKLMGLQIFQLREENQVERIREYAQSPYFVKHAVMFDWRSWRVVV